MLLFCVRYIVKKPGNLALTFGQRYFAISLKIVQSALRCSLFDNALSTRRSVAFVFSAMAFSMEAAVSTVWSGSDPRGWRNGFLAFWCCDRQTEPLMMNGRESRGLLHGNSKICLGRSPTVNMSRVAQRRIKDGLNIFLISTSLYCLFQYSIFDSLKESFIHVLNIRC